MINKLSTFDKVKIMHSYENEFPLKNDSRLEKVFEKYRKERPELMNNAQYHNLQITITRMTLIEFNLPKKEKLLEKFAIKNEKRINDFFDKQFINLPFIKGYVD